MILRAGILATLAAALTGCFSSVYLDVEAYYEDGKLWFKDPSQSWFTSHCVRNVTVTWFDEDADRSQTMWEADSPGLNCINTLPFRYGETERAPDRDDYIAPKPLVPGVDYEIFVELDNGAGSGSFSITEEGQVINRD